MTRLRPLATGDIVQSKYVIEALIKSGAFGSVYRARNIISARTIALKEIVVKDTTNFHDIIESRAQSLSGHPNVVTFHSGDIAERQSQAVLYIEMEFLESGSLADHMSVRFLSAEEATRHMKSVLFALEKAHSCGIIHRDIKPANILISGTGAKLSDFGVAYDRDLEAGAASDLFYWIHGAPEALRTNSFTPSSDVYCAGLAYHRLLNQIPELPRSPAIAAAASSGKLIKALGTLPHIPRRIRNIVSSACHADIEKRYVSASRFRLP